MTDRPPMLGLRKAAPAFQAYSGKLVSSGCTAMKTLEEMLLAAVLQKYKHQVWRRPSRDISSNDSQSADHPAPSLFRHATANPVVRVDEYVMNSELPERLVKPIDSSHTLTNSFRVREQQHKFLYCPTFGAICSMLFSRREQSHF
jgi:hypothetical protein